MHSSTNTWASSCTSLPSQATPTTLHDSLATSPPKATLGSLLGFSSQLVTELTSQEGGAGNRGVKRSTTPHVIEIDEGEEGAKGVVDVVGEGQWTCKHRPTSCAQVGQLFLALSASLSLPLKSACLMRETLDHRRLVSDVQIATCLWRLPSISIILSGRGSELCTLTGVVMLQVCGNGGSAEALYSWLENWQPVPPAVKRQKRAVQDEEESEEDLAWSEV